MNRLCACCQLNPPGFTLCPPCSQMTSILRKFGQNEAEHSGEASEHIRTEPSVLMWEIAAQCKTSRVLTILERRYLRDTYREAIRSALEAAGKPLPWLGKESAEPAKAGDARGIQTSGDDASRGASPKH